MKDAEYLFRQTEKERKRIGRGDFNKKRQGGKQIRFPSDYLTRKEREKLNGEVQTYDMANPVRWGSFKQWPADLQRSYLIGIQEEFNAKSADIEAMLGISRKTFFDLTKKIGLKLSRSKTPLKVEEWKQFLGEEYVGKVVQPEGVVCANEESSAIEVPEPVKVDTIDLGKLRIDHLCCLLQALKGSGAKLTLEVTI